MLLTIEDFEDFKAVKDYPAASLHSTVVSTVGCMDEKEELEPFIRSILSDPNVTPHGPAEIADILTHRLRAKHKQGLAAFILKGRSFQTVRPKDVAHQIYRLEKIEGLCFAVFAAVGNILDAAKEQFCSTAQRVGTDFAIFDAVDLGRLFVAYGFYCPRDGRRITLGRCHCGYSPKNRFLNVLQEETLSELARAHEMRQRSGIAVLPTGSGKTRVAAQDAMNIGAQKILYVAHTHEILEVAQSEFEAVFGSDHVKRITGLRDLLGTQRVSIATIQLLRNNLEYMVAKSYDYLVVDEFHHAAASSYRRLIERLDPEYMIGLTATPFRGDRQDIFELCDKNVLVNYELRTGIESGVLSPYHYFGCFDDIDYSRIRHNGTRYDIRDLERSLVIPERDHAIIRKWEEKAEGKPTIAFCCSHRHAQRVAASFNEQGISAAVYLSDTPLLRRQELSRELEAGGQRILCTVDVLNEGADFPFVECLLFLRPTESHRIFYQQLGRGLRRYVGKSHCIVIDFIGSFKNAYRIVEYQSLLSDPSQERAIDIRTARSFKDVLNLPLGCEAHFDERVIQIFEQQILDPRHASRHNIARILIFQYSSLQRRLKRLPTQKDVDRNLLLDSTFYSLVFGSWKSFQNLAKT